MYLGETDMFRSELVEFSGLEFENLRFWFLAVLIGYEF